MYNGNTTQKKPGIIMLILDKTDFRMRKIIKKKTGHNRMIKWSILHEGILIHNWYAFNNRTLNM